MILLKKLFCAVLVLVLSITPIKASALELSARSAIVICGDTGEILYSHNSQEQLPMASTTKIMTALLLCEYGDLNREITVTPEMVRVEGSSMGLLAGDTVSLRALLYGILLASGNDAANTAAFVMAGSVENFAEQMNKKAVQLGLKNTHFVTPSGLDAEGHYTTALDLAMLARAAMQNSDFATAAASESETLYYGNPPCRRTISNHNKLLKSFEGAVGVKTGFTKKSGRCLVSAAKRDGRYVIAVTLNAPDDWNDHRKLLEYGLNSTSPVSITPQIGEIKVVGGKSDSIEVYSVAKEFCFGNEGLARYQVDVPKKLYAPIVKGEIIGSVSYYCDDLLLAREQIIANETVEKKPPTKKQLFISCFKNILSSF